MALGKKTGGRKLGSRNVKTAARKAEIAAGGIMPLDYMLSIMRDKKAAEPRRDEMARAAAPYTHARLSSTEHTGKDSGPLEALVKVRFVAG